MSIDHPSEVSKNRSRQVKGSAAMMLTVWCVSSLAALGPSLAASVELSQRVFTDARGEVRVDPTTSGAGFTGALLAATTLMGILFILSPLLNIAWLYSLAARARLSSAIERGVRRYPAALMVSLALSPLLALSLGLGALLTWGASLCLGAAPAPTHDGVVMASALPAVCVAALWATWHELARARVAVTPDSPRGALQHAWAQLGVRAVLRYALYLAGALALAVVGLTAVAQFPASGAVALGQVFIVARIALRAFYLAGLIPTAH